MPEVTVLTAVRNGARFLPETIESIRKQTFKDWEYIIVDDASIDETKDIIVNYAKMDSRIIPVFRDTCGGPFVAANHGMNLAKGKYIVRTDADDISVPHRIQRQLEFLSKSPGIKACVSFGQIIDEHSLPQEQYFRYPVHPGSIKWFLCLKCPLIHSSTCIEKEAFLEIGGYRELPVGQDYRFFADLSRRDWLAVIPEDLVLFRHHPKRLSCNSDKIRLQIELVRDTLRTHAFELTGTEWEVEDAIALYMAGGGGHMPIHKGMKILKTWYELWVKDEKLTDIERKELFNVYAHAKRKFLRKNARKQSLSFLVHCVDYLFPWREGLKR